MAYHALENNEAWDGKPVQVSYCMGDLSIARFLKSEQLSASCSTW